jgi:RNA polymerase sigma-70 factor (ECF subfamily)
MVDADDARISDETLIGRMAAGDPAAFDRLIRRHQAAVYRFARAAGVAEGGEGGGAEQAEETLHETFRAARRGAPRYRDEPSARPWLLALARHAIDRRHPREIREADLAPLRELAHAAGWGGPEEDFAGDVEAALLALSAADREILTLCDREYFTVDEAARVAGVAEATVRTRLHRARLRLMAGSGRGAPATEKAPEDQLVAGLHCGEVLADLTEHLDGRLADRAQQIDEHLAGCERCRRFAGDIAAAVRALRELPDEPLPAAAEARLLAALGSEGSGLG